MTIHVNDGGIWRQLREVYVNDGGVWRNIKNVYVNDGGVWRAVFNGTLLPDTSVFRNDGGTPAEYYINPDGTVSGRSGTTVTVRGTWTNDPNTSDYECFATVTEGSLSSGTTGVWLNLGTQRAWTRGAASGAFQRVVMQIQLRRISTGEAINTAQVIMECDRT